MVSPPHRRLKRRRDASLLHASERTLTLVPAKAKTRLLALAVITFLYV